MCLSQKQKMMDLYKELGYVKNTLEFSHLFFVGDSIVFLKANDVNGKNFKRILNDYEVVSGQKVNLESAI